MKILLNHIDLTLIEMFYDILAPLTGPIVKAKPTFMIAKYVVCKFQIWHTSLTCLLGLSFKTNK